MAGMEASIINITWTCKRLVIAFYPNLPWPVRTIFLMEFSISEFYFVVFQYGKRPLSFLVKFIQSMHWH